MAVCLLLIVPAMWVWNATRFALDAEHSLHAMILVCDVIGSHVEGQRAWPKSWDDLADDVLFHRPPSMFEWPAEKDRVMELVDVRFDVTLEQLASQSSDAFDAVRPRGASFSYAGYVDALHERVRATAARNRDNDFTSDLPQGDR